MRQSFYTKGELVVFAHGRQVAVLSFFSTVFSRKNFVFHFDYFFITGITKMNSYIQGVSFLVLRSAVCLHLTAVCWG